REELLAEVAVFLGQDWGKVVSALERLAESAPDDPTYQAMLEAAHQQDHDRLLAAKETAVRGGSPAPIHAARGAPPPQPGPPAARAGRPVRTPRAGPLIGAARAGSRGTGARDAGASPGLRATGSPRAAGRRRGGPGRVALPGLRRRAAQAPPMDELRQFAGG